MYSFPILSLFALGHGATILNTLKNLEILSLKFSLHGWCVDSIYKTVGSGRHLSSSNEEINSSRAPLSVIFTLSDKKNSLFRKLLLRPSTHVPIRHVSILPIRVNKVNDVLSAKPLPRAFPQSIHRYPPWLLTNRVNAVNDVFFAKPSPRPFPQSPRRNRCLLLIF